MKYKFKKSELKKIIQEINLGGSTTEIIKKIDEDKL